MTSKHRQQSINLDGKVLDAGSMDIKIEVSKPQFYDEHMTDNFGLFDKRKATISLQDGQQDWFQKNSLVHEIFHLCVWFISVSFRKVSDRGISELLGFNFNLAIIVPV